MTTAVEGGGDVRGRRRPEVVRTCRAEDGGRRVGGGGGKGREGGDGGRRGSDGGGHGALDVGGGCREAGNGPYNTTITKTGRLEQPKVQRRTRLPSMHRG